MLLRWFLLRQWIWRRHLLLPRVGASCFWVGRRSEPWDAPLLAPGRWVGRVRSFAPQVSGLPLPGKGDFDLTLSLPVRHCPSGNANCGESIFILDDGSEYTCRDNQIFARLECRDTFAGANPSGQCYQFAHKDLMGEVGGVYEGFPVYGTLSVQTDDRLYWAMSQGMLVVADVYLAQEDRCPYTDGARCYEDCQVGNANYEDCLLQCAAVC